MPKIKLNEKDLARIDSAVKEAESKTSGEIRTALIKESYDYASSELLFSLIGGFIYFMVMLFFVDNVNTWLSGVFWDYNINYLILFYGVSTFSVIGLLYIISNWSFVDRLIVPRSKMQEKVHHRALRHFVESGVSQTRDRTGILIFISLLERRVEILADRGISEYISNERWNELVEHIIEGIRSGKVVDNLIDTINQCGDILKEHFPIKEDDENELSDQLEILEK